MKDMGWIYDIGNIWVLVEYVNTKRAIMHASSTWGHFPDRNHKLRSHFKGDKVRYRGLDYWRTLLGHRLASRESICILWVVPQILFPSQCRNSHGHTDIPSKLCLDRLEAGPWSRRYLGLAEPSGSIWDYFKLSAWKYFWPKKHFRIEFSNFINY